MLVLAIDFCNIWSDYQQAEFKMLCNLVGLHGWNSCNWTVQEHCKLQYSKCHMIMRGGVRFKGTCSDTQYKDCTCEGSVVLETHNPTNGKEALVLVILWFIGYVSVAAIADTPLTTHSQTLPELVRSSVTTSQ